MNEEKYPKLFISRLEAKGNLKKPFNQVIDFKILKETKEYDRKFSVEIRKTNISPKAAESKPVSFRSGSIVHLKDLLTSVMKMYGTWVSLNGTITPFNETELEGRDIDMALEQFWPFIKDDLKRALRDGFVLGLEENKVKIR